MTLSKLYNKTRRELYKTLSRLCLRYARGTYFGRKVTLPIIYGVGAEFLVAKDPWMSYCLTTFLNLKPGLVIDIGANTGLYLLKLRAIDDEREYLGFEPNPIGNHYIQELVRKNSFRNVRLLPFALSNQRALRNFFIAGKADKMGSLYESARYGDKNRFSFDVFTFPADEILETVNPDDICAIKIDVEGSELEVLRGLTHTLLRYKPYLYCEIWRVPDASHPTHEEKRRNLEALLTLLAELDYQIIGTREQTPEKLELLDSLEDFSGFQSRDYVLVHKDARQQMIEALKSQPMPTSYKP